MTRADSEAITRLRRDPRVDQGSLDEKIALVELRLREGDLPRAEDIGAELRVGARLLDGKGLDRLAFGERPDIRVIVAGLAVGVEVRRFRTRTEDGEDDRALEDAGRKGDLAAYGGDFAEYLEEADKAILKKSKNFPDEPDQVLVLVSDSPNRLDFPVLAYASRVPLPQKGRPFPFAAVAWWEARLSRSGWVPGNPREPSPPVVTFLNSLFP